MKKKVAQRRRRSKPAPVPREQRRQQQQRILKQMGAAIADVVRTELEAALEAEVTTWLGRERYERRGQAPQQPTGRLRCSGCHQDWAPRFVRGGHYTRTL